jgi:hypothetical protein
MNYDVVTHCYGARESQSISECTTLEYCNKNGKRRRDGRSPNEGNKLTAGELMQTIDIEDDQRELQIPTGLPEETYVTIQRGESPHG